MSFGFPVKYAGSFAVRNGFHQFYSVFYIKDTIKLVKAVPNGKGTGVFYWEPEAHSSVLSDAYPLGATAKVSKNVLKYTTAIDAFHDAATGK